MTELDSLYQEIILDHNRRPRNFKGIGGATRQAHGHNPLCGDDYHLYLSVDPEGVIQDVGFQGEGCAISKSSASMMTGAIKGKKVGEVLELQEAFTRMLTGSAAPEKERLGKLAIFAGVKKFPVRVKCAMLIWRALEAALKTKEVEVTTE